MGFTPPQKQLSGHCLALDILPELCYIHKRKSRDEDTHPW